MAREHSTGQQGELAARRFLEAKGYQILATNWHCQSGEIDIVARQGEQIVFVEVKTRRSGPPGDALAAITPAKRDKLIAAAYTYAEQFGSGDVQWRIDAIAVSISRNGSARFAHVEHALDW